MNLRIASVGSGVRACQSDFVAALRHTEVGAHERKHQSCEVLIHSFHGCKGAPPSITRAWQRKEDDGRSGHSAGYAMN
jgi:hypothetical protein